MANLANTFRWPKSVEIDQNSLNRLQDMLKETYRKISSEINDATDFGALNRQRILAQIEFYLQDLNVNVDTFLQTELTDFYTTGGHDAIAQLTKLGRKNEIFSMNQVNQEAVNALYSDASRSFADAINGVGRSAFRLISIAAKKQITNQIAQGLTTGQSLRETTKLIKGTLADQGLDALVDKGGRAWSLDDYATMLYQTKAAEARNLGLVNTMAANGYDLVLVSSHGATDVCADWEGKILSTTGQTKEFDGEDVPTVDEATADGLFHPNCRHTLNAIADTQLAKEAYYYTGNTDDQGNPIYAQGHVFNR